MSEGDDGYGYDLRLEDQRLVLRLIHRWSQDAIKVTTVAPLKAGQWAHVFITYNGSGQAAGAKLFINGTQQGVMTERDQLVRSVRTLPCMSAANVRAVVSKPRWMM